METSLRHEITRVRREPRRRTLTVAATEPLGSSMLRIRFTCDDLSDFGSASPDDHVKLMLPGGLQADGRPLMRDYTPRAFDIAAGTFVIDFALHEAGPATAWAMRARPGDTIDIGGPRGSQVVADDFDWYLLIGDETAIPAIARRAEELRPGVPLIALLISDSPQSQFALADRDGAIVRWAVREEGISDASALLALLTEPLPAGEGYVWIAGEATMARELRAHVVETLGQPRAWVKAAGYWTKGVADSHERIED